MQVGEYEFPDDLRYDTHNNWVKIEGDVAQFGLTDAAVKKAKDIAFIELPKQGTRADAGKGIGSIESAKWAGEIVAPLNGEIIEVNQALENDPSQLNSNPYGSWIAKIKINPGEADGLMDVNKAAEWINAQD